jgi:Na+-driven multidrug efflux pump
MSGVHLTLEETNPLLVGPIIPALLRFALPNMAAMLATALAAIAETSYVGHFGTPALAGMALVFPFVMLQTMMSAGAMGGGVSSAISRALGAGDSARANALAAHALWIAFAMGAASLVLMEFFGSALLYALGGRAVIDKQQLKEILRIGAVPVYLPCRQS